MKRLPIADCRLPINGSFTGRRLARGRHDCSKVVGFLQKRRQLARRHYARFDEQFEPQRGLVGLFFNRANFGYKFRPAPRAATGAIVCGYRSAAANDLFGDDTSGIVAFWNSPGQFDDSQGKRFGARFQFDWIHAPKLQTQSAIGNRQSAMQK
jgi:hypothetical protein